MNEQSRPRRPIYVTGDDVDTSDPAKTVIDSPALTEGLIRDQQSALDLLGEVSRVSLDDISIDDRGRIVISDERFVGEVEELSVVKKTKKDPVNWICGFGCSTG